MKYFALCLIIVGLILFAWYGFQWWKGSESVTSIKNKEEVVIKDANKKPEIKIKKEIPELQYKIQTLSYDFDKGENVATLKIPAMDKKFDVFWGTSQEVLDLGVGMYVSKWTTVPNFKTGHVVLSGHRDTVFRGLGEIEKGDIVSVEFKNNLVKYSIDKIWITDANDLSVIIKKDNPTLTLTTCYPFDFIGNAPKRYIVQGHLLQK